MLSWLALPLPRLWCCGSFWKDLGQELEKKKKNSGPILSYKDDTNPLLLVLFVRFFVALILDASFPWCSIF